MLYQHNLRLFGFIYRHGTFDFAVHDKQISTIQKSYGVFFIYLLRAL